MSKSAYLSMMDRGCVAYSSEMDVERLRENPQMVRSLAARVFRRMDDPHALTDWEGDFLPDIIGRTRTELFTDPQIEKVLEIEFFSRRFDVWDGVDTRRALSECRCATVDMDEDDEKWILKLYDRSPHVIYGREVRHLIELTRKFVFAEV